MARYGQKKRRVPKYPSLPNMGERAKVTRFRGATAFPEGPKLYSVYATPTRIVAWGEPPPGFVIGTTSATEWAAYWALDIVMKRIIGYVKDVRQPPFDGFPPYWGYQVPMLGGRTISGGAVIDLTVNINGMFLLIRVVTDHWHIMTNSGKLMRDAQQLNILNRLGRQQLVIDVLERDLIGDSTGKGAIQAMTTAVQETSRPNPAFIGTARRTVPL
jgi:hypothetical protein